MQKINLKWTDDNILYLGIFGFIKIKKEYIGEEDREYWYNYMLHDRHGNEKEEFSGGSSSLEKCKQRIETDLLKNLRHILA